MSTAEERQGFAAHNIRAQQVTVGSVTGWQIQVYDMYKHVWVSRNVMCSEEAANEEVDRLRANFVKHMEDMGL